MNKLLEEIKVFVESNCESEDTLHDEQLDLGFTTDEE